MTQSLHLLNTESEMWESPTNTVLLLQAGKTENKEIEYLKNVINKIDLINILKYVP